MKIIITNTYKTHREQFQIVDATDDVAKNMVDRFFGQFETPQPTRQVEAPKVEPIKPANVQAISQAVKTMTEEPKGKKYAEVVQMVNDTELYVVAINCGVCNAKEHTRLTSTRNYFVKCKSCDQKLIVDQMYDELLLADKRGIAFVANDPYTSDAELNQLADEMAQGESK